MNYTAAKELLIKFISEDFTNSTLEDEKPIIFVDGPYGVGKSYLAKKIIEDFKPGKKRKCVYYSLAGKDSLEIVNCELYKILCAKSYYFKKILSGLSIEGGCDYGSINYDFSNFGKVDLKRKKFKKNKILIVIDEIDRKCDSLDLNGVFALLSGLVENNKYKNNIRIVVIGNIDGIKDDNSIDKIISFRDKICYKVIKLDSLDDNFLQNISPDLTIDLTCYPYYTQMYCNARVLNRAKSKFKEIIKNKKVTADEKVGFYYFLLCYYYENESHFFSQERIKLENHIAEDNNNASKLVSEKYDYALLKYLKRRSYYEDCGDLIFSLVKSGTFCRNQIITLVNNFYSIENNRNDQIKFIKPIDAPNMNRFNKLKSSLNTDRIARVLTFQLYTPNDYIEDLLFICVSVDLEVIAKLFPNAEFPIEFSAFVENETCKKKCKLL